MSQTQTVVGLLLLTLGGCWPVSHVIAATEVQPEWVDALETTQLAYEDDELKISVKSFKLIQFKPMPDLGWTEARVKQFLDDQLAKHEQKFSLKELEILARQLSIQMKQAGLMFSRAVVLEQEVLNQQVAITFEDGLLGEVVVMDANRTKPQLLARPFMPFLQNTAIRHELDEALYRLDRLPGLDVFGFFSVTNTPGLSRLNLKVIEERAWKAMVHTDNHGSDSIGRERMHATLELLNMSGWGDELTLNIGRSYSQPGFVEGYAKYTLPVGAHYQPLSFLISNSDFELGQGFESLDVFGATNLARVQYTHHLGLDNASVSLNLAASVSRSNIDSDLYSELFFRDSTVSVLDVGAAHTTILTRGLSQSISLGGRTGNSDEDFIDPESRAPDSDSSSFSSLSAQYQLQYFHDTQSSPRVSFLNLRAFGASAALPAVEQTGLGGRSGVRGLPSGYFSADQGFIAHFGHDIGFWPNSWPGSVRLLADIGMGERKAQDAVANSVAQTAQFASLGLGYTWEKGRFSVAYDFGKIIHAELENELANIETIEAFSENKPSRHYLSISYDLGEHQ